MRFAVLGTGEVGRTLAGKLAELGHEVTIGTRDPHELMARTESPRGGPTFAQWHVGRSDVGVDTFAAAVSGAEVVVNATAGTASLEALQAAGAESLDGKLLIDVANPLDFSGGFPPRLSVCNDDSLGEQIQAAFPTAKVVKTLNTVNASVMVEPDQVPGEHVMFVSGNDEDAKTRVTEILQAFGWSRIIDLGGLDSARAQEMYLPLWLKMMGALGDARFNIAIAR